MADAEMTPEMIALLTGKKVVVVEKPPTPPPPRGPFFSTSSHVV